MIDARTFLAVLMAAGLTLTVVSVVRAIRAVRMGLRRAPRDHAGRVQRAREAAERRAREDPNDREIYQRAWDESSPPSVSWDQVQHVDQRIDQRIAENDWTDLRRSVAMALIGTTVQTAAGSPPSGSSPSRRRRL